MWTHRDKRRLRGRRMWGVHGSHRRCAGVFVSRAIFTSRARTHHHHRRTGRRSSAAAPIHGRSGRAVRHLHAGHDHGRARTREKSHTRRREDRPRGESLSLHRLWRDLSCSVEMEGGRRIAAKRGERVRTAISELHLARARSLADALRMLRDEQRTPIAGATDLYVALNFGTLKPRLLVDIWGIDDMRGISVSGETLVIGALSTYTDAIKSSEVAKRLPMLADAARLVGGPQIQNRGTIGGNIANASPAGDSLPVFAVVDAVVILKNVD